MAGIDMPRGRRMLAVFVVVLAAACAWAWARSAATVPLAPLAILRVDTSRPGNEFAPGAVGLSTEAWELGSGRLSAGHADLARLMWLLGPSVLRIGGGSVDSSWWTSTGEPPPPWATNTVTPADLSALRGLLRAAGWRVLLGVDLGHFEPARVADEARYAKEILGRSLLGIEIGNEPNGYSDKNRKVILRPSTYGVGEYVREAEAYVQALSVATPGLAVYGPALSQTRWLIQMGASASMFTEITQHYYPTVTCSGGLSDVTVQQPTVTELLSPAVRQQEDETLNTLTEVRALTGRPIRIGETGNGPCDGHSSASPTYTSALWALDWALRAASSGVQGLNFHGHLGVCGSHNQSPICAPSNEAAQAGDVIAQPEYYGLLAARQLEGGKFVPTRLIAPGPLPNLTTWATVAPGGTVRIAIDNLATSGLSQPVSIPMSGYTATEEPLAGPSVEARSDVALGGAPVTGNGQWRSKPAMLSDSGHSFRVILRPASAVIVTLRRKR
jgi:hypothetical protein